MKLPPRFKRDGISLAKGFPAFGGAVENQGLPAPGKPQPSGLRHRTFSLKRILSFI